MFQTNHTIYDYGSFAFWGAVLAGGRVMLADGYSAKLHPILAAVKKVPPAGWTTVDVSKLDYQTGRLDSDHSDVHKRKPKLPSHSFASMPHAHTHA